MSETSFEIDDKIHPSIFITNTTCHFITTLSQILISQPTYNSTRRLGKKARDKIQSHGGTVWFFRLDLWVIKSIDRPPPQSASSCSPHLGHCLTTTRPLGQHTVLPQCNLLFNQLFNPSTTIANSNPVYLTTLFPNSSSFFDYYNVVSLAITSNE